MRENHWSRNALPLADAFLRSGGTIRFELVTRAIAQHLCAPAEIVDLGGGGGVQAIRLAQLGHCVTIVDFDAQMLAAAAARIAAAPPEIAARIDVRAGDAASADTLGLGQFDLVCLHSILMYEDDPAAMIDAAIGLMRPGGLLSILAVNADAIAMRPGLQGRWDIASETMMAGKQIEDCYAPGHDHARGSIEELLGERGLSLDAWYGVGIFTDHATAPIEVDDPEQVYRAEWLAGMRDPYRQVARCYHLIARKPAG